MSASEVKIAIIGGGVAGCSAALCFANLGLDVTLFEKEKTLISGPPWCHLHAGGNLYREIPDAQCVSLLKQSIDFVRFYPFVVDYRPTVIALPLVDISTPESLLPRLDLLANTYRQLIKTDARNEVLGKPEHYYKLYTRQKLEELKEKDTVSLPQNLDEWMIPVAKIIDPNTIQFPLIIVQEYGLNLFRMAAGMALMLEDLPSMTVQTQSIVHDVQQNVHSDGWNISYTKESISHTQTFDYLINAAGFRTGKIDDLLGVPCKSMVEFKASYVSHWEGSKEVRFPEIVFHGERGTPQGMGQFTPYPNGYFQLHGMTHDITLFEEGLVSNTPFSCQPQLNQTFIEKIENSWTEQETVTRTKAAISHLSQFIPSFLSARVGAKPLFGAQQIPGGDPTLRVAEVSFPHVRYARCEIVKVSSALDMTAAIAQEFVKLGYLEADTELFTQILHPNEATLNVMAKTIAQNRGYPEGLAQRNISDKQEYL